MQNTTFSQTDAGQVKFQGAATLALAQLACGVSQHSQMHTQFDTILYRQKSLYFISPRVQHANTFHSTTITRSNITWKSRSSLNLENLSAIFRTQQQLLCLIRRRPSEARAMMTTCTRQTIQSAFGCLQYGNALTVYLTTPFEYNVSGHHM